MDGRFACAFRYAFHFYNMSAHHPKLSDAGGQIRLFPLRIRRSFDYRMALAYRSAMEALQAGECHASAINAIGRIPAIENNDAMTHTTEIADILPPSDDAHDPRQPAALGASVLPSLPAPLSRISHRIFCFGFRDAHAAFTDGT